ncbi:hypothetical protein V8F06_006375 [Rhypophila decipiens]
MSRAGSLQEEFVRAKLSSLAIMNWTDGKLYQNNRARGSKANGDRRRPKELFPNSRPRPSNVRKFAGSLADLYPFRSVSPEPHASHPHSLPGSSQAQRVEIPKKTTQSAAYQNLPTIVDEFMKEWNIEPKPGGDARQTAKPEVDADIEKLRHKIMTRPPLVPPRLPPMVPTKKRRLRETKITDMEEFNRQRRETLSHVVSGRQELRRILSGGRNPPKIQHVKVRIGSQEKRLGASSTNMPRSSQAFPTVLPVRTRVDQSPVPSITRSSSYGSSVASRRKRVKRRLSATSSSQPHAASDEPEIRSRVLTHSPIIHAPVPIRHASRYFGLSDAYDSQDANSAVAQPARAVPLVPTSQRSGNNIWRNWLESASGSVESDKAVEGSVPSIYWPPVSPGISETLEKTRGRVRSLLDPSESSPRAISQAGQNEEYASDDMISSGSSFIINPKHDLADPEEVEESRLGIERPFRFDPADKEAAEQNKIMMERSFGYVPGNKEGVEDYKFRTERPFRRVPDNKEEIQNHKLIIEHPSRYSPEPVGHQSLAKTDRNGYDLRKGSLKEQPSDPEPSTEDPEEAWKAFVLRGVDSDDPEQAAFEEAKHDAAMYIRPSDPSFADSDQHMSDAISNVATVGTQPADHASHFTPSNEEEEEEDRPATDPGLGCVLTSSSIDVEMSTDSYEEPEQISSTPSAASADSVVSDPAYQTSVSFTQATTMKVQVSSSSLDSEEMFSSTRVPIKRPDISSQPLSSSLPEPQPPSTTSALAPSSSLSEAQPESTASGLDSVAVQPPNLENKKSEPNNFRFAPPKLFVGNRSSQLRQPAPLQTVSLRKPRRGRQRARASDGRASIRALPNYNSDPIEEFEDEVRDPLFPPLEMESESS